MKLHISKTEKILKVTTNELSQYKAITLIFEYIYYDMIYIPSICFSYIDKFSVADQYE